MPTHAKFQPPSAIFGAKTDRIYAGIKPIIEHSTYSSWRSYNRGYEDVRRAIGLERTAKLYHMSMYGTPDAASLGIALADYFIEFLVADDDDGDLSNGTPNSEAIITAFNAHGIPGSAITITHTPIGAGFLLDIGLWCSFGKVSGFGPGTGSRHILSHSHFMSSAIFCYRL